MRERERGRREYNALKFMQIEFSPAKYNFSRIKLNVANTMIYMLGFCSTLSNIFYRLSHVCVTTATMLLYRLIMRLLMSFRIY